MLQLECVGCHAGVTLLLHLSPMLFINSAERFVDRQAQRTLFELMLNGQSAHKLLVVQAEQGMGKSWLLDIFADHARAQEHTVVRFDLANQQYDTPDEVMQRCRDEIGEAHFPEPVPPKVSVDLVISMAEWSTRTSDAVVSFANAQTGDVAVGDVAQMMFKQNAFFIATNQSNEEAKRQREEQFFQSLKQYCATRTVVFLFDAYERTSRSAEEWNPSQIDRWIREQLVERVRRGYLKYALVVLAGQRMPTFDRDLRRGSMLASVILAQLHLEDVKEYFHHRLQRPDMSHATIETLWQACASGHPAELGKIADNILRAANTGTA